MRTLAKVGIPQFEDACSHSSQCAVWNANFRQLPFTTEFTRPRHGGLRLRLAWHESFRGSLCARQLARFARLLWMDVACDKHVRDR